MKTLLKAFAVASLTLSTLAQAAVADPAPKPWDQRVYSTATSARKSWKALAKDVRSSDLVVLGEEHYNEAVQKAQARVITESFKPGAPETEGLLVGWEFMYLPQASLIQERYSLFQQGSLTVQEFLDQATGQGNESYAPIFEAAKALGAGVLATNLTRAQKKPVTQGGLAALDPALIPPGFALGDADYFERFTLAIGGDPAHPVPMFENYFAAQCLTDDVMAYELLKPETKGARVLVTGSFHAEYFDGAVARLKIRAPEKKLVNIRILDASHLTKEGSDPQNPLPMTGADLEAALPQILVDSKYGALADYVVFVNEPAASN